MRRLHSLLRTPKLSTFRADRDRPGPGLRQGALSNKVLDNKYYLTQDRRAGVVADRKFENRPSAIGARLSRIAD